ncbi:MAG: hypothetical protein WBP34_12350 [Thermoanaerobaculia bacterium]
MKKIWLVLLLATVLAPSTLLAGAIVIHDSGEEASIYTDESPEILACIGEAIEIDCVYRWHETTVIRPNGRMNYQFHANDNACAGVGAISGTQYKRLGADNWHFSGNGEPPFIETYTSALNFIAPGPGNNILFLYKWNLKINANGDTVVFIDDLRVECQ